MQLPKLELKDAEIQTSIELGQLRNQQMEQYELGKSESIVKQQISEKSPSIASEPEADAGHPGVLEAEEDSISPQKLIDLQLVEIERAQKHKAMMTQAAIGQGLLKLSALIWKQ